MTVQLDGDPLCAVDQLPMPNRLVHFIVYSIENFSLVGKKNAQTINDHSIQIARWDASAARTGGPTARHKRGRYVVPISGSLFDGPGRCQPISHVVEDPAGQQAWLFGV